jgi:hypothetical protein
MKITGLFLWEVSVARDGIMGIRETVKIWITTEKRYGSDAFKKAESFTKKYKAEYPRPEIEAVSFAGELSA